MRFNCLHTFTLEAKDRAEFDAKLQRYSALVGEASRRQDIGYAHGVMCGNPQVSYALVPSEPEPEPELDTLFDA